MRSSAPSLLVCTVRRPSSLSAEPSSADKVSVSAATRAAGSGSLCAVSASADTPDKRNNRPRTPSGARSNGSTKSAAGAGVYWDGEVMREGIWGLSWIFQLLYDWRFSSDVCFSTRKYFICLGGDHRN